MGIVYTRSREKDFSNNSLREETKKVSQRRLAIIVGQLNGLAKMIEEDRYCPDVLTQLAAIRVGLEKLGAIVVSEHIEYCIVSSDSDDPEATKLTASDRIEEVQRALMRLLR